MCSFSSHHSVNSLATVTRSSLEVFRLMGACFGRRIKADRAPPEEGNAKFSGNDGDGRSLSSSEVLSDVVLPTNPEGQIMQPQKLKSFSLTEIKAATKDFHQDGFIGEGGFGVVFKGWIDEHTLAAALPETGIPVAVMMLKPKGTQEWLTEIKYLGHLQHPNLVKLIGYCLEDNLRFLVYEFIPNGSLANHLFEKSLPEYKPLSWDLRMKIALTAAKAMTFLHKEAQVIHQSFSAANILLDLKYNVKLSDFGLVMDDPSGANQSHVMTTIMHTHGCLAPEYKSTGHSSMKSDIYMFGVVLLQILTGRRAIDHSRTPDEQNLVEWAMPYLNNKRKTLRILDARLEGQFSSNSVLKAADLIVKCLSTDPKLRPDIDMVVKALEQVH